MHALMAALSCSAVPRQHRHLSHDLGFATARGAFANAADTGHRFMFNSRLRASVLVTRSRSSCTHCPFLPLCLSQRFTSSLPIEIYSKLRPQDAIRTGAPNIHPRSASCLYPSRIVYFTAGFHHTTTCPNLSTASSFILSLLRTILTGAQR